MLTHLLPSSTPSMSSPERPHHIGYMRVSRPSQADGHISFEAQKECIRAYSKSVGAKSPVIFHDVNTGVNSAFSRRGLQAAIMRCSDENAVLIVQSVDRLARSLDVLELLDIHGVTVVSVSEGAVSAEGRLAALLEKANTYSAAISERSAAAHRARRASGRKSGNLANLIAHRARGTCTNKERARAKVDALVAALSDHPELLEMTRKEQARYLNRIGVLNELSVFSLPVDWTAGALRKPLKAALDKITGQTAPDCGEQDSGSI